MTKKTVYLLMVTVFLLQLASCVTVILFMCCYCNCKDDISSGIHGKDTVDKAGVCTGTRSHCSGVRRHTVSGDVNTTAVSIIVSVTSLPMCYLYNGM